MLRRRSHLGKHLSWKSCIWVRNTSSPLITALLQARTENILKKKQEGVRYEEMLVCYLYSSYPLVSYAELLPFKGTSSSGAEFKGAIPVTEMKPNFNHKLTPTTQHCSKTFSAAQVLANSFCYTVQTFKIYQISWLG